METLTPNDAQKLNHSIQQLYTFQNLDTFGVDALSIVDQLVASDKPLFHLTNTRTGQIQQTFLPNDDGVPPELNRVLNQVLSQNRENHPIAQHMPQTLHGVYKISDFVSKKELHSMEGLYQQFLRPLGIEDQILFFLPNVNPGKWSELAQADHTLTGFILNRSHCNFTERDRLILNLLRPHIFQAHCNAQQYQHLAQELNQIQQSLHHLGVVIIDLEGQIKSIAPQAAIWLETYFSKPTGFLKLPDHLWSWVKHQVTSLYQATGLLPAYLPLHIEKAGRKLVIRLVIDQTRSRYFLLLEEQTRSCLHLLALLGLSQRETEVLSWVIQGKDNKTIATQMNLHMSTVRKHLENIYLKWEVQSRTEAIAQALEKLGLLDSLTVTPHNHLRGILHPSSPNAP
jgi:DNA-binding CsgD family transcriptional regulator